MQKGFGDLRIRYQASLARQRAEIRGGRALGDEGVFDPFVRETVTKSEGKKSKQECWEDVAAQRIG